MALSNRDRVGRAFEQLATGLGPYVDRRMRAVSRSGKNWLSEFAASARPPVQGAASLNDPALQLRVVAESWDAFRSELTRSDRNVVFELRDVRSKWAHNEAFTVDDTYRALDSIERLLVAVDASEAADVGRSKEDLMRLRFEAQTRKAMPPPAATPLAESNAGLKPWRDVVQPHDDVARGRFTLAEFAAHLHEVAAGRGAAEYTDPVEFFRRTFLTDGLRLLLGQAVERMAGTGGSPVVDLQTSFGGGKTHSMIALYHLFSGTPLDRFPQEVQDLVRSAGATELSAVRRAVVVGTELPPGSPKPDPEPGRPDINTLWGELAWQIGGTDGFALVAEADRTKTNPGSALRLLFEQFGPCLVLIDEWVAYARGLWGDDTLRGGTFDTHFTFAQTLTEAARGTPGVLLVVSIPASVGESGAAMGSEAEVGGAGGREALRRLRVVVGRLESSWRAATSEESFEIVRRRLFQPVDVARLPDRDATARVFGELYRKQAKEFPPECREPAYEERIKRAYPLHPELFARLYEDWSTLEGFQQTRGVLRLAANVIYALWSSGDQSPLILPGTIPLNEPSVSTELTRNLDNAWKPIIDADVDGPQSLPKQLDDEFRNLGRYQAARRVARAVFLGSAPIAGSPNQGLDANRVRLGCALPGETVAIYADALNRMADRATYFYSGTGRYWYGTQPGVTRLARDRANRLLEGDRHELHQLVVERLTAYRSADKRNPFGAVHIAPSGPDDVSDTAEARLVILGPTHCHQPRSDVSAALGFAKEILASRGSSPRGYRNMLVFLAADDRRVEDLLQAVADYCAWQSVVDETKPLALDGHQEKQAADRLADADHTVDLRLAETYQWLLAPRQPEPNGPVEWDALKVDGQGNLVARVVRKLEADGRLFKRYPRELLNLELNGPLAPLWENGHVTVANLWEAYARYLYLHRLTGLDSLCAGVQSAPAHTTWATEGAGVAEAYDERRDVYLGAAGGEQFSGTVRGTTLVVRPEVIEAQRTAERQAAAAADGRSMEGDGVDGSGGGVEGGDQESRTGSGLGTQDRPPVRRFFGVASVDPERLGRDAARIATEVVAHLNALVGTDVEVTIEVTATNPDGFADDLVRIVGENSAALSFRAHGFERT